MKFGLLFRPQAHLTPPTSVSAGRRSSADRRRRAAGWDGVFVPEHHMMPDAYLPSPWPALGALAAVSRGSTSAPPCICCPSSTPSTWPSTPPWSTCSRAAAEARAPPRQLPSEFEFFGLNPKTQVSRFEEAIEILQRLWAGETLDHSGKHFTVKGNLSRFPKRAELWMGAMSEPGIRRAAPLRRSVADRPLRSIEVMQEWKATYRRRGRGSTARRRSCRWRCCATAASRTRWTTSSATGGPASRCRALVSTSRSWRWCSTSHAAGRSEQDLVRQTASTDRSTRSW